jgi:hypothetical protein
MPQPTVVDLALNMIRLDGGTQQRDRIHEDTVAEYADAVDSLPPVVVFHDGADYWLAGGFHRYHAHRKAERDTIRAEVRQGTLADAILFACGDNAEHGLRRTPADKRKAVHTLLDHPVWGERSARWIADAAKVSNRFVGELIKDRDSQTSTVNVHSAGAATQADAAPTGNGASRGKVAPSTRTGRDGRRQPAPGRSRTRGAAKTSTDPIPEDATPDEPVPEPGKDALGIPVPLEAAAAFADREHYRQARSLLRKLFAVVSRLAQSPGGAHLAAGLSRRESQGKVAFRATQLEEFKTLLNGSEPHAAACPWCHREHPGRWDRDCKACQGLGWVPLRLWRRAPAEDRERVERELAHATS